MYMPFNMMSMPQSSSRLYVWVGAAAGFSVALVLFARPSALERATLTYDDAAAVAGNPIVSGNAPLVDLAWRDFWGEPLASRKRQHARGSRPIARPRNPARCLSWHIPAFVHAMGAERALSPATKHAPPLCTTYSAQPQVVATADDAIVSHERGAVRPGRSGLPPRHRFPACGRFSSRQPRCRAVLLRRRGGGS